MKLSIVIVFWDKDYLDAEKLYKKIKERVNVKDYEIITIDNREKAKDVELCFTPTYSFGYNARQLAARKKSLEFVKGKYVWFVDADDEVLGLSDFDYEEEDCIIYDVLFYDNKKFYSTFKKNFDKKLFCNREYKLKKISDCFDYFEVLWNKIIKTEKIKKIYDYFSYDDKIIFFEDGFVCNCLDKVCKKVIAKNSCIYKYNLGYANQEVINSVEHLNIITTGCERLKEICKKHAPYVMSEIKIAEDWTLKKINKAKSLKLRNECFEIAKKIFSKDVLDNFFKENVINTQDITSDTANNTANKTTNKKFTIKKETNVISNKTLSIVALLHDENVNHYESFINRTISNNFTKKNSAEIIIVDNREKTKNIELKKFDIVKIIDACGNKGILQGRKIGALNSNNNFIWFVELDDIIFDINIYNILKNVSKNIDIVCLSYLDEYCTLSSFKNDFVLDKTHIAKTNNINIFGTGLYNKLFKKDFILKCFDDICLDDTVLALEDEIIKESIVKNSGKIVTINELAYKKSGKKNAMSLM